MASEYICSDGDTLDRIMWFSYGLQSDALLNGLLAANRGIADLGPVLIAGTVVVVPDQQTPQSTTQSEVRLWD